MSDFLKMVAAELDRARAKHPGCMRNKHEAYAVILEELDEFWDEVRSQQEDRDAQLKELIQTAAMCMRAAEDMRLLAE